MKNLFNINKQNSDYLGHANYTTREAETLEKLFKMPSELVKYIPRYRVEFSYPVAQLPYLPHHSDLCLLMATIYPGAC